MLPALLPLVSTRLNNLCDENKFHANGQTTSLWRIERLWIMRIQNIAATKLTFAIYAPLFRLNCEGGVSIYRWLALFEYGGRHCLQLTHETWVFGGFASLDAGGDVIALLHRKQTRKHSTRLWWPQTVDFSFRRLHVKWHVKTELPTGEWEEQTNN